MTDVLNFSDKRDFKGNLYSVFSFLLDELPNFTKYLAIICGPVLFVVTLLGFIVVYLGSNDISNYLFFLLTSVFNAYIVVNFVLSYIRLYRDEAGFNVQKIVNGILIYITKTYRFLFMTIFIFVINFVIVLYDKNYNIENDFEGTLTIIISEVFLYILFSFAVPISAFDSEKSPVKQLNKALKMINGRVTLTITAFVIFAGIAELFSNFIHSELSRVFSEDWFISESIRLSDNIIFKSISWLVFNIGFIATIILMTTYSVFTYFGIKSEEGEIEKSRKGFHI